MDEKEKLLVQPEEEKNEEEATNTSLEGDTQTPETVEPELNSDPIPTQEQIDEGTENLDPASPENTENLDDTSLLAENTSTETVEPAEPAPTPNEPIMVDADGEQTMQPEPVAEQTFTQSQVNEVVGKVRQETRNKTFKYIYDRYGVNDEAGMDELVGNAQRYDSLNDEYQSFKKDTDILSKERDAELNGIKEQLAFLQSGIDKERYDDAKFILKGKGLEINLDNISSELQSHPEWKKQNLAPEINEHFNKVEDEPSKLSVPNVLGNVASPEKGPTEEEQALKMFKL